MRKIARSMARKIQAGPSFNGRRAVTVGVLAVTSCGAFATDPVIGDIVTAVGAVFASVAALAITITGFKIGKRLISALAS